MNVLSLSLKYIPAELQPRVGGDDACAARLQRAGRGVARGAEARQQAGPPAALQRAARARAGHALRQAPRQVRQVHAAAGTSPWRPLGLRTREWDPIAKTPLFFTDDLFLLPLLISNTKKTNTQHTFTLRAQVRPAHGRF
ncbi:jg20378 [Pararge aegeria aegeria]|uniref:Jg20378 protein n=1 Tax=Pararge aegeria aegeria TaxID=348720 RepID=A0A8S4QPI3_9NEOP|nr:jg20378 [Pararge aegeria aegeria]